MDRMKTFLIYFLLLVGFIFLSYVLENGLIENMYVTMFGNVNSGTYDIAISDIKGKASSVNGNLQFTLENLSGEMIHNCYAKIDLYSEQGLLAVTKYVEILDLKPNEKRDCKVKFKANEIEKYRISIVQDMPDKTNIINILGWEIDLTNVFGMDLSNAKIFGVKIADMFQWDDLKTTGQNVFSWISVFLASVPWWGYVIGSGIILWYMPVGFLFGLFPL